VTPFLLATLAFISGAVPYSVLVGKFALRDDIRTYGDHNPGATNVFRAGGKQWGILAAFLDGAKAAIPVLLAVWIFHITGIELVGIALAPILGHAYSPFLGFKGGKAVGATFGTWIGLTLWEAPIVLGLMLVYWFMSVKISGWAVVFAMLSLLGYLLLAKNDPTLLAIWLGNFIIFILKHRADLSQAPGINYWLPFIPKPTKEQP
jgi:glycerol-3-phosphate acyltransferase PlsY